MRSELTDAELAPIFSEITRHGRVGRRITKKRKKPTKVMSDVPRGRPKNPRIRDLEKVNFHWPKSVHNKLREDSFKLKSAYRNCFLTQWDAFWRYYFKPIILDKWKKGAPFYFPHSATLHDLNEKIYGATLRAPWYELLEFDNFCKTTNCSRSFVICKLVNPKLFDI